MGKNINIADNSSITTINNTIAKGSKYVGDDGTEITKQLGETLDVVGGAESSKLTDGNIGINNISGKLKVQLAQNVNLGSNGTLTAGTAVIGKSSDGKSYVTGLDNKEWAVGQTQAVSGRAATEDQLKQVSDAIGTTVSEKSKWTIQDNQSGSKVIDSATPLTVSGDDYITTTVRDSGLALGMNETKLNNTISNNSTVQQNKTDITTINNTIAKGTKYVGDDGTAITKQLGETLDVVGGADGSKLTDGNIGVNNVSGKLKVQLAQNVNLGSTGTLTAGSAVIGKSEDGKSYVTGLDNKEWTVGQSQAVSGRAATEDQLKQVSDAIGTTVNEKSKWTIQDNQSGSKVIDSTTPLVVSGDQYVTTKVSDTGMSVSLDADKLGKNINIADNSSISNINNTVAKGTKYVGDDGTEITKQLGETLDVVGGADSTKLTDGNIGVNNIGGKLKVQLAQNVNLGNNGTLTAGTAVVGKANDGKSYVTGLDNKEWAVGQSQAVSGRAATEDQLKQVSDAIGTTVNEKAKWTIQDGQNGSQVIDSATSLTVTGDGYITTNVGNIGLALGINETKLNDTITNHATVQQNKSNISALNTTIAKGRKYVGDDGTEITKQLGETLDIVGGATGSLTDNNIGVANINHQMRIRLAQNVNLGSHGTVTAGTAVIGRAEDGKSYVTGLGNKEWVVGQTQAVSGRAATEDQLKQVSDAIKNSISENAQWTIKDANSEPGSKNVNAAAPLVVAGDLYVTTKVDDNGLKVGIDANKLGKNINIIDNSSITTINNTLDKGLQFATNDNKDGVTNKLGSKITIAGAGSG